MRLTHLYFQIFLISLWGDARPFLHLRASLRHG